MLKRFALVALLLLACGSASAQTALPCTYRGGYPWTVGGCLTADDLNAAMADAKAKPNTLPWGAITSTPTTLLGYGITGVPWSLISGTPTTLAGYGVTSVPWNLVTTEPAKNNGDLASLNSALYPNGIWRNGVLVPGDASPIRYIPSPSPCSLTTATFTGSIAGSVLTVSVIASGTLRPGLVLAGISVPSGLMITSNGTGTGGTGTYNLSASAAISSQGMTAPGDVGSQVPDAVGKCWVAVFPDNGAPIEQWGADKTGVADSYTAINSAVAWSCANNSPLYGAPGTYKLVAGIIRIICNTNNWVLNCAGPNTIFSYSGTTHQDSILYISPGNSGGMWNASVCGMTLTGNSHVDYALHTFRVSHLTTPQGSLVGRNVATSAFYIQFLNTGDLNLDCSNNEGAFTTRPTNCLKVDDIASNTVTGTTSTSTSLTGLSTNVLTLLPTPWMVGLPITGAGIPANTTISAIAADGLSATLSQATTASASGVTFTVHSGGGMYNSRVWLAAEGAGGDCISIATSNNNSFYGTGEGCGGHGLVTASDTLRNSFNEMDFEADTLDDVIEQGTENYYRNPVSCCGTTNFFNITSTAQGTIVESGSLTNVFVASGAGSIEQIKLHPGTVTGSVSFAGTAPNIDYNGGMIAYTPVLSCGSGGPLTTASATGNYRIRDKEVFAQISASITTNGTCATSLGVTLPFVGASGHNSYLMGRDRGVGGNTIAGIVNQGVARVDMTQYNNAYPAVNGSNIDVSGVYQTN